MFCLAILATLSLRALSFKAKDVFEHVGKTRTRHWVFFCVINFGWRIFTCFLSLWVAEGCWWHCRTGSMRRWYKYGRKLLLTFSWIWIQDQWAANPPSELLCKASTILSFFLLVFQNYRSFISSIVKTNQLLTGCLFLSKFPFVETFLKEIGQSFMLFIIYVYAAFTIP